MSHVLTEVATFTPTVTVCDDGDQRNAASVDVALQALTNRTRYLINGPISWTVGSGGLSVVGPSNFAGAVTFSGSLSFYSAVAISSIGGSFSTGSGAASTFAGLVTVNNQLTIGTGGAFVTNPAIISVFGGPVTFSSTAQANGAFTFAGSLGSSSGVVATWNGPHTFNSATTFNSAVSIASGNNLTVSGTSTLTGNASCGGSLSVTGTTTHTGDVTCNGQLISAGSFSCTGSASFTAGVFISGNVTFTGAGHLIQRFSTIANINATNTLTLATADYYSGSGTLTAGQSWYVLKASGAAGCRMTIRIANTGNFSVVLYSATATGDTLTPITSVYTFGTTDLFGTVYLVHNGTDWILENKVYPA